MYQPHTNRKLGKKNKNKKLYKFMAEVSKIVSYLQLFTEICRRNTRLLDIILELHHLINVIQRTTWNCIYTPLHVLHNNTATLIQIPCFDLIINQNAISQSQFPCSSYTFHWQK